MIISYGKTHSVSIFSFFKNAANRRNPFFWSKLYSGNIGISWYAFNPLSNLLRLKNVTINYTDDNNFMLKISISTSKNILILTILTITHHFTLGSTVCIQHTPYMNRWSGFCIYERRCSKIDWKWSICTLVWLCHLVIHWKIGF